MLVGRGLSHHLKWIVAAAVIAAAVWLAVPKDVRAQMCLCPPNVTIKQMRAKFHELRDFAVNDFFEKSLVPQLQAMTESLSAIGVHQVYSVGTFMDAKNMLETRRTFETLKFEAHKDYQPNEAFCAIGTNVRSLAQSAVLAQYNQAALNKQFMDRLTGKPGAAGSNVEQDEQARWDQFKTDYCDPQDNNWGGRGEAAPGLSNICGGGARDPARVNSDIDFTRLIEKSRTLNVNFTDSRGEEGISADEEDVLALGHNLFAHNLPQRNFSFLRDGGDGHQYMAIRSLMAKRNVARSSYDAMVAMKSAGSPGVGVNGGAETAQYLAAALRNLGMTPTDITEILGENPSYYAQLEVLSKKLYQSPQFIASLYDSPANVERKKAALNAIELLVERAIFESEMRQEMALSVLLASDLNKNFNVLTGRAK